MPDKQVKSVLIVEDNHDIASLLEFTFNEAGYKVVVTDNGKEALELARKLLPDLVVLDIMLPGLDGISVLKELRRERERGDLAVIMLTAKAEEIDRVVGLELGADDYVVKPFSPRELLLRAKVALDRPRPVVGKAESLLQYQELQIDLEAHNVTLNGEELNLTATEFRLLADLVQHHGKARSREQLLSSVWGYSFDGYARTVDTHMRRLRQKLKSAASYIETLRGVGYKFKG